MNILPECILPILLTTFLVANSINASPINNALDLLSLAATTTPPSNLTLPIPILGDPYSCFDAYLFNDRRAKVSDCTRAAAFLPNRHEPGTFHRGDSDADPFALPYVETYHSCSVKVDLKFGRPDEGSWLSVNIAVKKIIEACMVGQYPIGQTGGVTTAGTEGRIAVTVGKTQAVLGLGTNETGLRGSD
ncbi:hypothetical protein HO173_007305 [Letharia columbiana]|uniref:Ecp2 effector protein domain-containing protein n=1 Tax=Letharia columbiana TaxID=112416 RepID=A0A8H6FU04_9LECA|nr:uncharacterized protein HO173_007305 [Letharia columbiana]KAF6234679.1 hypothetical protein HO173_007305 [Letharia columbiana]